MHFLLRVGSGAHLTIIAEIIAPCAHSSKNHGIQAAVFEGYEGFSMAELPSPCKGSSRKDVSDWR